MAPDGFGDVGKGAFACFAARIRSVVSLRVIVWTPFGVVTVPKMKRQPAARLVNISLVKSRRPWRKRIFPIPQ